MSALIRAVLSHESVQVCPGGRSDLTLIVQNFSEIVDRYRITVEGIDPEWVSISRPDLALFPKDRDQVRITLHPPRGPGVRGGSYQISIQVISEDNPSERTSVPVMVEVATLHSLEVSLRPQRASGWSEGTYRLRLANRGNVDLTARFEALDPEDDLLYTFDPARPVVPAGQERQVQLKARPRIPLRTGESRTYHFTVTTRANEDPKVACQVHGEWVQSPPTFEVVLRPDKASGAGEGIFAVEVDNPNDSDLTVQLEATDGEQACLYLFHPPRLTVPAGQKGRAELRVRSKAPPAAAQPRIYSFTVTARLVDAAGLGQQAEGKWEQVSPTFELLLPPQKGAGVAAGLFNVWLKNPGRVNLTLQLDAADPQQACLYAFTPPVIVVPAGQDRWVQMQVRPRVPLAAGPPRCHTFTIRARAAEFPHLTRTVVGEWAQIPTAAKPWGQRWIVWLVLGLVLLILCLWLAIFAINQGIRFFTS